mgnify:FL=1
MSSFNLTNANVSDTFQFLLQVRDEDKTLFDALGNTLDDFRVSGSFTATEFIEIGNGDNQTGNKLHSRSGTLYWGDVNLQTGGSGLSNMVEDTTPQLGGNLDLNNKTVSGSGNFLVQGSASFQDINIGDNTFAASFNVAPTSVEKDIMLIKSGSFNAFKFNQTGVGQFGAFASAPTAVSGGIYYNSSQDAFYLGV